LPGIRRRPRFGIVDVTDFETNEKPKPRYCHRCKELFGVYSVLGPRIMPLDKTTGKPMPKPTDYGSWLECHGRGTVYGKYEVKQEAEVTTLIEPDTNPFDKSKIVIEAVRETRKVDRTGKTYMKRKRKQQIDNIKDPDVKIELKKPGTELLYYQESKDP
jgi:hypothetical protein